MFIPFKYSPAKTNIDDDRPAKDVRYKIKVVPNHLNKLSLLYYQNGFWDKVFNYQSFDGYYDSLAEAERALEEHRNHLLKLKEWNNTPIRYYR